MFQVISFSFFFILEDFRIISLQTRCIFSVVHNVWFDERILVSGFTRHCLVVIRVHEIIEGSAPWTTSDGSRNKNTLMNIQPRASKPATNHMLNSYNLQNLNFLIYTSSRCIWSWTRIVMLKGVCSEFRHFPTIMYKWIKKNHRTKLMKASIDVNVPVMIDWIFLWWWQYCGNIEIYSSWVLVTPISHSHKPFFLKDLFLQKWVLI